MNKFSIILTSILTRSDGGVNYTPETESPGEDDENSFKPETNNFNFNFKMINLPLLHLLMWMVINIIILPMMVELQGELHQVINMMIL